MVSSHTHTYRVTTFAGSLNLLKLLVIERKFNIHADLPLLVFFYILACLYMYCNIPLHLSRVFLLVNIVYHTHKIIMLRDFQFRLFVVPSERSCEDTIFLATLLFSIVTSRIFKCRVFSPIKQILLGMFTQKFSKFWL